jgi:aspartate kinase
MPKRPTIMKFGGTSVADSGAFANVSSIVAAAETHRPVVVVSAIAGCTNALLASVERARAGELRGATRSLEEQFERHTTISNSLVDSEARAGIDSAIAEARRDIRQLLKIIAAYPVTSPPLQDQIVAYGELLSSQLLAAVLRASGLQAQYVDARTCVTTDENFGAAIPLPGTTARTRDSLSPLIEVGTIPVLGGFIGSTEKGLTTV